MASSPRIEELRKKFEENPRRYFAPLANEYRKAGDVQQAISICREYLPQQPGHMSGHIVFGQALYEARSFEEAKAVFETALSLDPENLIALRHLGDISLILNDSEGARTWYTRVLEADPRNEEIQAQLATIEKSAAAASGPATAEVAATAPAPAPVKPDAATAETVVIPAVSIPEKKPVTSTSPTAEINLDAILPSAPKPSAPEAEIPPAPAASSPEPVVAAAAEAPPEPPPFADLRGLAPEPEPLAGGLEGLESTSAAAADAPIGSFSLDGLETTSFSDAPPSSPPAATEPAPLLELEPPAAAPVSLSSVKTVEVQKQDAQTAGAPGTLELDLSSMSAPATPIAPPAAEANAPASSFDAPLDLDISIPSPAPAAVSPEIEMRSEPATVPAPEPHASLEPVPAPTPEPLATSAPPFVEPAPASTDPFVTETMAELYVQQGHLDEAERVYRALLDQRPGDGQLMAKLEQLRQPAVGAAESAAPAANGPTIRELLAAVAARRPGHRPEWPTARSGEGLQHAPVATPSAPAVSPASPTVEDEPARADTLAGALGFSDPVGADQATAIVLSRAFTRNGNGGGAPVALPGEPARPAGDELSLRKVFNEPAPAPSSFSFEQFFAQRPASAGDSTIPQGQAIESPEEVAHFTAWLEGLKKR